MMRLIGGVHKYNDRYRHSFRIKNLADSLSKRMELAKKRGTTYDTAIKKIYELEQKINKLCDEVEDYYCRIEEKEAALDTEKERNLVLRNKMKYMNTKTSKCIYKYLRTEIINREACHGCCVCEQSDCDCGNMVTTIDRGMFRAYDVDLVDNKLFYIDKDFNEQRLDKVIYLSVDDRVLLDDTDSDELVEE